MCPLVRVDPLQGLARGAVFLSFNTVQCAAPVRCDKTHVRNRESALRRGEAAHKAFGVPREQLLEVGLLYSLDGTKSR